MRLLVAFVLLLAVVLFFFNFSTPFDKSVDWLNSKLGTSFPHMKNVPFRLGLDLQGGSHLVYEADLSKVPFGDKSSSVEGVRDVIEKRVNAFGVSEPVVQINKSGDSYRIIVELAGIKDVNQAIDMIGKTPLLEFKEQNTDAARELTAEEQKSINDYNNNAKIKADNLLKEASSGKDFATLAKENSEDNYGKDAGGDVGFLADDSAFGHLYVAVEKLVVGQVSNKLIEQPNGYYIAKLTEKKEDGVKEHAGHILICWKGAERCTQEITKEEALKKIQDLKTKVTIQNFAEMAKANSTEPGAIESGGDIGWFRKGQMVEQFENVVFPMKVGTISDVVETPFGYHLVYKMDEKPNVEYKVSEMFIKKKTKTDILPNQDPWKFTGLSGKQLTGSTVQFDQNSQPEVSLKFNEEGKKLFGEITARNVGKPVAIFLDGEAISTPRVNEAITDGSAVISGKFDVTEAKLLSQRLNAGALPVPINLISQETVGASLGNESLQRSLFAGLMGFILVIIFMVLYYRLPGIFAALALLIYGTLVLFIFKTIPVTLTLAGIAGFILSVGMAVDANVLIFERLKEELRIGKPMSTAISEAFKRAWPSIRDSNTSTIITCVILFWFGSSVIKGFAFTLTIGVLVSMFSAIVITRLFIRLFVNPEKEQKRLWLFGVKKPQDNSQTK